MILALAGNQNCGKTTLFNALTGSNQHVGNFPGVTVEHKIGEIKGKDCSVVDLPGIYSLRPYTQEEIISRDFILKQKPDGIINIVDATNIERNLYLTLQLLELHIPVVLALNMMDEVRSGGGTINVNEISRALGIPVVPITASKGEGVSELLDAEYNPATQEITFSTSSFSNYAIAYEEQAQGRYFIDFTNAPWTVDGVEVDLEGRESVAELMVWITTEDVIPLTNFDPDTMDAVLIVDEDVTLCLNVDENGNTRLADVYGGVEVLPPYGATMTFAVVAKPGGEGENVYYIDLGTGDWTVGDVTVSAPDGMSGVVPVLDTETIPTEMLANFDPETMDITLTVSDGFVIYLEIDENGNTTLVSTRDGVELPPYGETLIFSVVKKPETESYTLTDDKGNVISLTYEKNRELSFTMIDYLAFSPEDLETAGISQEFYDSAMKGIKNATKQHGTLLSFYEIQVENDDGFLIHEGPFYIKIKMTDEMKKYDIFKIVYIDVEDNLATESPITLTRDGEYLVGTLEHLSTYALVGDNAPGENDAPADSDTSAPTSPQTGDNSNLGLWVFLLVLSSCSMIALIVIDKKRKIAK